MKKLTTGTIYRLFKENDNQTIIRRPNLRKFCIDYNIDHIFCDNVILIDFNVLYKKLNPKNINKEYTLPRLRTKASALREWNSHHRKKIKHHIIDCICNSGKVFVYKHGNMNIINYDELEKELIKILKDRKQY